PRSLVCLLSPTPPAAFFSLSLHDALPICLIVSDLPFGFSMPNDPDDESGRRSGDSGSGAGSGGPGGGDSGTPGGFPFGDPQQMANMLRQFADMMSSQPAP